MAFSLVRALSANVIHNIARLKQDAKRLHRNSLEIFGAQVPLTTCQRAMAVARGFRSLDEVERIARMLGMDRKAPFFTLHSRNDTHQEVLDVLYRLQLEMTEGSPVVLLGEQKDAILPALVLFLEEMSARKRPGLILVETERASRQDTVLQGAANALGVEEMFDGFRTLDLREKTLSMSVSTTARHWTDAISEALPHDTALRLENSGWLVELERLAEKHARGRRQISGTEGFETIPFYSIHEVAHMMSSLAKSHEEHHQVLGGGRRPPQLDEITGKAVFDLIKALDNRNFAYGVTADSESLWRPFVALFSRDDPCSVVLAGVLHSFFYWRSGDREKLSPILYLSEGATPWAPRCLTFGDLTVVVNGLEEIPNNEGPGAFFGYGNALKATATAETLQYMGTRLRYG